MIGERRAPRSCSPSGVLWVIAPGRLADPLDRARRPAPRPSAGRTSWYFSDDEPELSTRTGPGAHAARRLERSSSSACAWTAVMATVLTMSSTRAPRDRSLTGLRRPCSTGPMATAWALRCTAL